MESVRSITSSYIDLELEKQANRILILEKALQATNAALEKKLNLIDMLEYEIAQLLQQIERIKDRFALAPTRLN